MNLTSLLNWEIYDLKVVIVFGIKTKMKNIVRQFVDAFFIVYMTTLEEKKAL